MSKVVACNVEKENVGLLFRSWWPWFPFWFLFKLCFSKVCVWWEVVGAQYLNSQRFLFLLPVLNTKWTQDMSTK